ncbi:MAG: transcription antitermination factor NusB [Acidobacteriota bacterium]
MPARHKSRQRALQVLFLWDQRKQPVQDAIQAFYATLGSEEENPAPTPTDEFMESLVRGTSTNVSSLDQRILAKSDNWRLERMAVVDRNILRMAVYEMQELRTPPAIAIDEALELAREFSADESVSFINGVLDAIYRDNPDRENP